MPVLLVHDIGAEIAARQDTKVVVGRPLQAGTRSLITFNTRTFCSFVSVTSVLSLSLSSVRVSANLKTGLPLSHALP